MNLCTRHNKVYYCHLKKKKVLLAVVGLWGAEAEENGGLAVTAPLVGAQW